MTIDEIDLYDPEQYVEGVPHDDFTRLRTAAPVFRHADPEVPEGFWAITRHADVTFVSRNPELFSSWEKTVFLHESDEDQLEKSRLLMLNMDPPEHTRLRGIVNRGFTPRTVQRLHEAIGSACERIVDEALTKGEGDFVTLCAAELPLVVIADVMGVPQEDRHRLFHWSNRMIGADDPEMSASPEDQMAAQTEMFGYANELGAQKRGCPVGDIVSKLVSADEQGNELSEFEFDMFFLLLSVAGNETTRNAISGGMLALIEHPDQWERLRANISGLVGSTADEIVRWVSPVIQFRRTATRDVEIGGQPIKAGEKVVVYYPSANRDEAVFADPFTFDIGRDPNPHLGFGGGGPHFCLGRHLAQLELEVMFQTLAEKVERVEFTAPVRRLRSNFINGIKEMPVRFVPAG